MADLMFRETPSTTVLLKLLDQVFFEKIFKNSFLSRQGSEDIPLRAEMTRKQESRGISEDAGVGICLKTRLQWIAGIGHRR